MAKRRSIKSIVKAVRACGVEVARYEIKPDGTVVIVPGKPGEDSFNPWDEALSDAQDEKRAS